MALSIDGHRVGSARHGTYTGQAWPTGRRAGTASRASRAVPPHASCLAFGPSTALRAKIRVVLAQLEKHAMANRPSQHKAHDREWRNPRRELLSLEVWRSACRRWLPPAARACPRCRSLDPASGRSSRPARSLPQWPHSRRGRGRRRLATLQLQGVESSRGKGRGVRVRTLQRRHKGWRGGGPCAGVRRGVGCCMGERLRGIGRELGLRGESTRVLIS